MRTCEDTRKPILAKLICSPDYGVDLTDEEYQRVMEAYTQLEPYEDLAYFGQLRDAGQELYILSDGNQNMLNELAENTDFDEYLSGIISIEDVEVFKPHPKAYQNIENHTDRSLEECTMVATHTFDVAGAQTAGMKTILVNRFNVPATRLSHTPDMVVDWYAELATELS